MVTMNRNKNINFGSSLIAQRVKNLPKRQVTRVQFLDQEDPWRRKWQPTPVFLPGESWTEEPGRLQSMGSQESDMT